MSKASRFNKDMNELFGAATKTIAQDEQGNDLTIGAKVIQTNGKGEMWTPSAPKLGTDDYGVIKKQNPDGTLLVVFPKYKINKVGSGFRRADKANGLKVLPLKNQ